MTHHTSAPRPSDLVALDSIEVLQGERDKLREVNADLLAALEAAEAIVTQHNLLSTATRTQRSNMIERHINWWNDKARTAIDKATATSGNSQ